MMNYFKQWGVESRVWGVGRGVWKVTPYALLPTLLLLLPILYLATLAQTLVLGDPTEYTFIANIVGVAHPPGYVFMTLLGKLFQLVVPVGTLPWRMHLLAATAGTASALFVFGTIRWFANQTLAVSHNLKGLAGLFGALVVGTAVNHWQHSIHTNPHIVTQTFLAANLYLLTRWAAAQGGRGAGEQGSRGDGWLYGFCLLAGVGVTHHPLTVFAFPAYAVFVLWQRPFILRQWQTLLKMVGCALLGLSLWLYLPLRSPLPSAVGTVDLSTLEAFLTHILGRGISDDLGFYGLADLPNRLIVLWSILRLQYTLPVLFLALLALAFPFLDRFTPAPPPPRSPASLLTLYTLALLGNLAFTLSLQRQDIMAYLLGPLLIVGLLAGIGLLGLLTRLQMGFKLGQGWLRGLAGAMLLLGVVLPIVRHAPLVSLRGYNEGEDYVTAVFTHFTHQNQAAVLLNDWEHMTPLWYTQLVEKQWPNPADVRPEFVSAARPWLPSVFDFLPGGPVYLSNYRREIVDAGFRLRPSGPFYQVVEPGDETLPAELTLVSAIGEAIEVVGYQLPNKAVLPGDYVPLTLALRTPGGTADFYVPIVRVGDLTFAFTTDSHLTTPTWLPGEVIVERFDVALPHNLPAGEYPVTLGVKNLSSDTETPLLLDLGTLRVGEKRYAPDTSRLLANFRQRVGLRQATARLNGRRAIAPWPEPLAAQPGDTVNLVLQWEALDYAEESYTVFVHLIDVGNRPLVTLDYTPLGGAVPTHLWVPKWLPGQRLYDPYRLQIPSDLPPGQYLIEVGLYEMVSRRRLHMADGVGNLVGDRYILGSVVVEAGG